MSEPLVICIVGAGGPRHYAHIRDIVEREGHMVVNVGTIGHVDQGKTTLTAALERLCREIPDSQCREFKPGSNEVEARYYVLPKGSRGQGKGQRKANKRNRWK